MDGWRADWVGMQSSSTEAFFKEISLLTRQGSPWPTALLAVDPAPPSWSSWLRQATEERCYCLESGALVSVFQKKPLPTASVPPPTATQALCLLTRQHWPADGLQPRSSCMPHDPSPYPKVCQSLSHLVHQPLFLAMRLWPSFSPFWIFISFPPTHKVGLHTASWSQSTGRTLTFQCRDTAVPSPAGPRAP